MDDKNKEILSFLVELFFIFGLVLMIRIFVLNITLVNGDSMLPNLEDGDLLVTQKVSLYFRDPEPGEIVVIEAPGQSNDNYIKRVVAVEGDSVKLEDGQLLINGQVQNEPYLNQIHTYPNIPTMDEWLVPEDHVYVLGDNRGHSNDSRSFGPIHIDDVLGISEFRLYPFRKIGSI